MPFVLPSTVVSCMTMTFRSFVTPMSSSSMSAPAAMALRNAYIVFDGDSSSPPWWAMLMAFGSRQRFPPWARAAAGSASSRTSASGIVFLIAGSN